MDELLLRELRTEFDRYMDIINILERKAQNLSVISTILITILIGAKILDNNASLPILIPLSITVGLLLASIMSSRSAAGVHGQVMPINFRQFFILNGVRGEQYSIDDDKISRFIVQNSKMMDEKKSSNSKISQENRSINLQIHLINEYLRALHSAVRNGERIAKRVQIAQKYFSLGVISSVITVIILSLYLAKIIPN